VADANRSVLIVDDNIDLVEAIRETLETAKFRVFCAINGEDAIGVISREPIDAILCDLQMEGRSGLDVLHDVRSNESIDLPFVVLSGHITRESLRSTLQLGAFDFVDKPAGEGVLVKVMSRACEIGQIRRKAREMLKKSAGAAGFEELEGLETRCKLLRLSNYRNRKVED
jgi:two-component system, NtrC family, nitrogen regulation response regulator NtrX